MATTTGQDIVDQARILLQDVTVGGIRWTDPEMLIWVNAGQRSIAQYKPDASIKNESVVLVEGTKQSIPEGGNYLVRITRNMGVDGLVPGSATRVVDMEILDTQNPDWHTDTASSTVKHYVYDERDPTVFYVTPPQPSSAFGYVEMVYSATPNDLTQLSDTLDVLDIYSNPLVDFVMYRALSKDATYTKKGVDAETYNRAFLSALGVLDLNKSRYDPNRQTGNPNANFAAAPENGT